MIHPGQNNPTQTHSTQTSIRYEITQCENMIGAKPPGFPQFYYIFTFTFILSREEVLHLFLNYWNEIKITDSSNFTHGLDIPYDRPNYPCPTNSRGYFIG